MIFQGGLDPLSPLIPPLWIRTWLHSFSTLAFSSSGPGALCTFSPSNIYGWWDSIFISWHVVVSWKKALVKEKNRIKCSVRFTSFLKKLSENISVTTTCSACKLSSSYKSLNASYWFKKCNIFSFITPFIKTYPEFILSLAIRQKSYLFVVVFMFTFQPDIV